MTGIDYPTVTIDGRKLTVKLSLAAQMLMRRRGIDVRRLPSLISPKFHPNGMGCVDPACAEPTHTENPDVGENVMKIFACMVAHEFVDLSNPSMASLDAAPSADYWTTLADFEEHQEIMVAVWTSLGKVLGARLAKLQVVPPPATTSLAS